MLKMSIKQVERAHGNPQAVANELNNAKILRKGFRQHTIEICLQYGKGLLSLEEARDNLQIRLSSFKDSEKNRVIRNHHYEILDNFAYFIEEYGLKVIQNYAHVEIVIDPQNKIAGQSCPIFMQENGRYCGVIMVNGEYDYTSIRNPIEKIAIAKKLKLKSLDEIDMYLFHMDSYSHELLPDITVNYDLIINNVKDIFKSVEKLMSA